jgi:hypothetical protein
MADPSKPLSPAMRGLRVLWAGLIIFGLVFSILMAAWGDLREALMLKLLDDRHVKSFTLQAPQDAKLWMGTQYLGVAEPHPLAEGEPDDTQLSVEGMIVLRPRVYFYEPQLMEQSAAYEPGESTADLLAKLVPDTKLLWIERDVMGEEGFVQALLRHDDGRLDFVNLARVDWPGERRVFVLRVETGEGHVFRLERMELWSDQLCTDESGFWPQRTQYNDLPPNLDGQCKTVWRWFLHTEADAAWLKEHAPGETDVKWFKLPETE